MSSGIPIITTESQNTGSVPNGSGSNVLITIIGLALVVSIGINFNQQGSINAYKVQEKLYEAEGRILKDEVYVLDQMLSNKKSEPTYEEGLADGLQRSTSIGYVDGYHAAISQNADYENHMKSLTESKTETDEASKSAIPAVSE
jgi:hypothetical protein